MDQLKWTTPSKRENKCHNMMTISPKVYKTPVKQTEVKSKHMAYQTGAGCFSVLPTHITPPSGLTKFIARNPFESDLTNRLHLSVISPTVFSKVSNASQNSPGFTWSVEELAMIQPAKIEEFPMQQMHCIDPEAEVEAQAAIDQFFKENQIIPSPWEIKRKESRIKSKTDTSARAFEDINSATDTSRSKKDAWCQTVLSFPAELPPHVEEILKPYFTFTQDQTVEPDDPNSSNSSLRRKLFFNHDDCTDNDEESSICLSPVKMNGSMVLSCSPPQSGMLIHGTPLKCSEKQQRTHGTSVVMPGNLSPPNMSPIHSTINNMSCESVRSRSRSVARLDFTSDMSIDQSVLHNKENTNCHSADNSYDKAETESAREIKEEPQRTNTSPAAGESNHCERIQATSQGSSLFENNGKTESTSLNYKQRNIIQKFKLLTDSCKVYTNESCVLQQTNLLLGTSDQQSIGNSVQDTGYQTYSMSSTTNVTDSYDTTPTKQQNYWGDGIALPDEELPLSDWKENIKNMFCSTPSRSNQEKDNYIF